MTKNLLMSGWVDVGGGVMATDDGYWEDDKTWVQPVPGTSIVPELQARIAALEAQLAQYRWRRVEEEMPENGDYVLVLHSRSPVPAHIAYHLRSGWTWAESGDPMLVDPHYWMPLPAAPEEGE